MWFIGMHSLLGLDGGEDQRDGHGRHTRMLPCEEPGIDIRRTVNMYGLLDYTPYIHRLYNLRLSVY